MLHLGFLLSAPVFLGAFISQSQSQKGHFCLIPHNAHVQQYREEIIIRETRTIEGGNHGAPLLITQPIWNMASVHSSYLSHLFITLYPNVLLPANYNTNKNRSFNCFIIINQKWFQETCRSCDSAWTSMAVPFLSHWMSLTHDSSQLTHFQLDHWYSRPSKELFIWLSANSSTSSISSISSAILWSVHIWLKGSKHVIQLVLSTGNSETTQNFFFNWCILLIKHVHILLKIKLIFLHQFVESKNNNNHHL